MSAMAAQASGLTADLAAQAQAAAEAADRQARLNTLLGVVLPRPAPARAQAQEAPPALDTESRAADIAAYGAELDRLQAKFDPLFAASQRYNTGLSEIAAAERAGTLSGGRLEAAIEGVTAAYVATGAPLKSMVSDSANATLRLVAQTQAAERAAEVQSRLNAALKVPLPVQAVPRSVDPVPVLDAERRASVAAYGAEIDRLREKYDPLYAAARRYAEALDEINAAQRIGALDTAQAAGGGFPQGTDGGAAGEARYLVATGDQLRVADAIHPLRPVTALVIVAAPVPFPVPFVIQPAVPVPVAAQAAVRLALDAVFLAKASPLGGAMQTVAFLQAIAAVPGMPEFTLQSPAAAIVAPVGSLPVESVTRRCGRSMTRKVCTSVKSSSRLGPQTAVWVPPTLRSTSISTTPGVSSRIVNQTFCFSASV